MAVTQTKAKGDATDPRSSTPAHQSSQTADHNVDNSTLAISRSNRAGLIANIILMLGYAFTVWFQAYEFAGRDRETVAIVVYFLGFALLVLSGCIELSVDVFSVRVVGHGRYHSESARWNISISYLFICAGVLDIVAFVYWMRREKDIEITVLLVSSYVLFTMATLVLYFQVMDVKQQSWPGTNKPDRIDLMANILFFATTVLGVVLRHMEHSQREEFGEATNRMELAMMPMLFFSSVLYVITDAMRL